jgi:hypothetical protein
VVEADPELEAEVVRPEANDQETQAESEKPEPKKKRRKRG